ncbi:UNVERIFIED_CONTAM: putative chalcone--flavonone isomerase 3 [Sesamum indicum]
MVDGIPFPSLVNVTKPLSLLGHGITDIEIHFLQIKFTAIGVYLDPQIVSHLHKWKGKSAAELTQDHHFFQTIISAPVDKLVRVVVIKEIKGSQFGVQIESAVRDRLAEIDKYEEEEEEALEQLVEFFQSKYFNKDSVLTFYFSAASPTVQIGFAGDGKEEAKMEVKNGNVVEMIQKWYLGSTALGGGIGAGSAGADSPLIGIRDVPLTTCKGASPAAVTPHTTFILEKGGKIRGVPLGLRVLSLGGASLLQGYSSWALNVHGHSSGLPSSWSDGLSLDFINLFFGPYTSNSKVKPTVIMLPSLSGPPAKLGNATVRRLYILGTEVEDVMVDEIPFPPLVNITKPLSLLGHGVTAVEMLSIEIKFTAIGVYLDPQIVFHLHKWKGKSAAELTQDHHFFQAIISGPVDKLVRVVVIKEIKGSQFGVQIESAVRDRLAEIDKYEEEEEEAVEQLVEFFQSKYFNKDSVLTFYFSAASPTVQIGFAGDGKEEAKMEVKNGNVVEMIQKWYLGGSTALSPTTISSLATSLSLLTSQIE